MTTRLERDVNRGPGQPPGEVGAHGVLNRRKLGVVLPRPGVVPLAKDFIPPDHERAHQRVGAGAAPPALGQHHRPL